MPIRKELSFLLLIAVRMGIHIELCGCPIGYTNQTIFKTKWEICQRMVQESLRKIE